VAATGTLEKLALSLGQALQTLQPKLAPDRIEYFLAELGIGVPAGFSQEAQFAGAAAAAVADIAALAPMVTSLANAVTAGNASQIIAAAEQVINQAITISTAFSQAATAMNAAVANAPGLTPAQIANLQQFSQQLVQRLLDYVVIESVRTSFPGLVSMLDLIGVIDYGLAAGTPGDLTAPPYRARALHLERIINLFTKPQQYLRDTFGWGAAGFDGATLFSKFNDLFEVSGIPSVVILAPGMPPAFDAFVLRLTADTTTSPPGLLATLRVPATQDFSQSYTFAAPWSLDLSAQARFDGGVQAKITPPFTVTLSNSATVSIQTTAGFTAKHVDGSNLVIFGETSGSGLFAQSFGFSAGFGATWNSGSGNANGQPVFQAQVTGGKLIIDMSGADGFLSSVTSGNPIEADFDFSASWAPDAGIHIVGGGQLQLTLPVNLDLGPVSVSTLYVDADVSGGEISLALAAALGLTLGPIAVSVDQVGLQGQLGFPAQGGNLGVANLTLGFKPPNGLGLSIDAGVVSGGGYISFDQSKGQYAGVLDVTLAEIVAVKVIGVLDTKLPDGSSGYSFLLIITFNMPPVQLGFGFTLSGVGGLGGVNRTMVQDALRAGLRAHTLDDILFPPDPIANAPQIISDIESFFPPQQGRYLFGPMVQIGWGELNLVEFALGIILEVPDPIRLAILGEITVAIPDPDAALISFKIDVLGTIDFGLDKIAIDGTMYDSYVLLYQISGDMAFRLNWGANPEFLLSLGGFNSRFQPPPDVPALQRLSVSLGSGSNPRFSSNSYFAVTSNTLQFGANVDAYASAGGFSVHGYIGWDALFNFSPFSFEIDFSAGFDISYQCASLSGIQLTASLSGTQPWHLHGSASFNILFFSVSATIDLSWGDSTPATVPSQPVMPPLLGALGDPRNWAVTLPPANSQTVSLRTIAPDAGTIVVHPLGSLSVRETIVPLDITVTKFNSVTPSDGNEFQISAVTVNGAPADIQPLQEYFAIAQFTDMSDADKLSAPSYELLDAGATLGAIPIENGDDSARTVAYQERYIDDYNALSRFGSIYEMPAGVHSVLVRSGQAAVAPSATTGLRTYIQTGMKSPISVADIPYAVASTSDLTARTDVLASNTTRYAVATALRAFIAANPSQQGAVQVVTAHEVAA
jgi:hypothetical protein